jgi:cellobiose phosphorylase
MASLNKYLVRRDLRLIQLLDPPFNGDGLHPGYIEGYVPGVRENGGQYSHAAIWALIAFAALGDREKVWELFSMVQPLSHAADAAAVQVYKVEPYVMAADVYANESHKGRGGWTWYTGSSGWMYQFITGSMLGMELQVDRLAFKPCFPLDWPSVTIVYRHGGSTYRITVFQVGDALASRWEMEGGSGEGAAILLTDDGGKHLAKVYAGRVGSLSSVNGVGGVDGVSPAFAR